jgi:serine phosphatase RsbU (regulator of sigma subunit)
VLAVAEAVLGPRHAVPGILLAGPVLAAVSLVFARAVVVSMYAASLAFILNVIGRMPRPSDHVMLVMIAGLVVVFAGLTLRLRQERDRALADITRVAEVTQRAILRPMPATMGGVDLAAHHQSANRAALIGGDFYDAVLTPAGTRLIVGDVKGNGLDAVRLATIALGLFRETAYATGDLVQLAAELDARIRPDLGAEDFVTVVLAEFTPDEVRLVNCGHHPPVRVGYGRLDLLEPEQPTVPLGLDPAPVLQCVQLESTERLLFYTDGMAEARNPNGAMFELDDGARRALTEPVLADALRAMLALVFNHSGRALSDDLVLVLAERANGIVVTVIAAPVTTMLGKPPPRSR